MVADTPARTVVEPASTALPVVYLLGATAAGKSALALNVARRCDVELISVDSAQVYRGLDIGTAKPDAATRAEVPHHLIDIRAPTERYSAAEFAADALAAITAAHGRGKVPLLVGGTVLYFKALHDGLAELPGADPALRAELDQRARAEGWPALHAELARIDPLTAARLAPNDRQRIQRALEVFRLSGRRMGELHAQPAVGGLRGRTDLRIHQFAVGPERRGDLDAAIATRFEAMLDAGLMEEVATLRALPGMHAELPAMRSVGYRQALAVLEGRLPREELLAAGVAATRALAKRQYTWLRQWPGLEWLRGDTDDADRVLAALRR